ncbi:MAG: O-antigen ligase family protein [Arenicella sp.]|nr:O-antigen ligase family protein [Arenicella sp.]
MQKIALSFALILAISASLIKAGMLQWASLSWAATAALGLSVTVSVSLNKKELLFKRLTHPAFLCFIGFQLWVCVQIFTPVSLNTAASIENALLGAGFCCLLILLYFGLRQPQHLILIYKTLLIFGLLQATYGLAIAISQHNQLLWMEKIFYLDRPTGTFVNPNHFAAYLSIILIMLISHAACHADNNKNARKSLFWALYDQVYNPHNIIAGILIITILATKSIGILGALSLTLLTACIVISLKHSQIKALIITLFCASAILILFILSIDYSILEQEIEALSHTVNRRLALSGASLSMVSEHWLLGVGGGAFYSVFSAFRDLDIGHSYYNYAHNDYLQFWAEYGIIGLSLLIAFLFFTLRENLLVLKKSRNPLKRTFAYTSLYSSLVLAIHSLVDFPLHIPGYSVLYLSIISVNVALSMNGKNLMPTKNS